MNIEIHATNEHSRINPHGWLNSCRASWMEGQDASSTNAAMSGRFRLMNGDCFPIHSLTRVGTVNFLVAISSAFVNVMDATLNYQDHVPVVMKPGSGSVESTPFNSLGCTCPLKICLNKWSSIGYAGSNETIARNG